MRDLNRKSGADPFCSGRKRNGSLVRLLKNIEFAHFAPYLSQPYIKCVILQKLTTIVIKVLSSVGAKIIQ